MNASASDTADHPALTASRSHATGVVAGTPLNVPELAAGLLLSTVFLSSGLSKLGSYAATASYLSALGVPAALLPVAIGMEVVGGLAIALGWKTRLAAFLLSGYTLLTAVAPHGNISDPINLTNLLTNASIAGGLLLLVANGPGALSMDGRPVDPMRGSPYRALDRTPATSRDAGAGASDLMSVDVNNYR